MFSRLHEVVLRLAASANGLLYRDRAQTLAEYGLIMALIAVFATVMAIVFFRDSLTAGFNSFTNCEACWN